MLFIPHCDEAMEWTTQALDLKLSLKKRILLRLHLRLCAACRQYHTQMGILHTIMNKLYGSGNGVSHIPHVHLSDEQKTRIKNNLQTHQ